MDNCDYEEIRLDDEIGKIIKEEIANKVYNKYLMIGKDRTVFSNRYLEYAEEIRKFEIHDDDVWVVSYPKTGTTWTQEMVWMIANNLDFEGAKEPLAQRFPFLEMSVLLDKKKIYENSNVSLQDYDAYSVEFAKRAQPPRFIKTHLPFSLLPEQLQNGVKSPKIICVIRNPKDTCVSFYHHVKLIFGWRTTLEKFAQVFLAEKSPYGSYWKHILSYWNKRHLPNLLLIKYEDMKSDLSSVIKLVAQFLNKETSEEQVQLLCKHLSFETMKSNSAVNFEDRVERIKKFNSHIKDGTFMRAGTVGKYKEELSPETIAKFNEWIKKNVTGTGLEHEYIFQI